MERKEIESRVNGFLVNELEIEATAMCDGARLKEDLGLDSLDFVDMVVIVENTFGFKIRPEEMAKAASLKEFYDYIESKMR
jgi:acyl carrier protein